MSKRDPWNPLRTSYPFSEKINRCSPGAETLYTRLLAQSDDNGNYYGSPRQILAQLYNLRWERGDVTDADIAGWRDELIAAGLLRSYQADGREHVHMVGVKKILRKDIKRDLRFPPEPHSAPERPVPDPPEPPRPGRQEQEQEQLQEKEQEHAQEQGHPPPSQRPGDAPPPVDVPAPHNLTQPHRHVSGLIDEFNRTVGGGRTLVPGCNEQQLRRHLVNRGLPAGRIEQASLDDIGAAHRRWRKRVGTHSPADGRRTPTWGLWYLADVLIEADNTAADARKLADHKAAQRNPFARQLAKTYARDAENTQRMHAAWAALPGRDKRAIMDDHRRRHRIANEATARAEWWQQGEGSKLKTES
ncbi:MAG: hypothetical protein ACYS8X_12360 [Planctomycetota bacterium]|jgi:hypothetical protein